MLRVARSIAMRMIAATAFAAALLGAATDARADEVSYQLWIDNTPPSIVESATRAGKAKGEVIIITDPAPTQVAWEGKKLVATAIALTAPFDRGEQPVYE